MRIFSLTDSTQIKVWLTTILLLGILPQLNAQNLLDKSISIDAQRIKLSVVLKEISEKGGFYFSYNGRLLPQDSLVTIVSKEQSISVILKHLFKDKYDFEERKNYVIIIATLKRLVLINTDLTAEDNSYSVSGLVVDERTGERLMNASVYEKQQLVSSLTDEHGYFKLRFKMSAPAPITVTASKRAYHDTTLHFLETVLVNSRADKSVYSKVADNSSRLERTGLGRLFISTRQMIQSMNIPNFFASRPYQVSLTPGLSTHGMFSPQVVNKFSLNLVGGYTAGVNGLEIGGLFNINKRDARYLQMAGIFNLAGGNATGLQLAGAHNRALDTVRGAQLALFTNNAGTQLSGFQLSALHNKTHRLKGLQVGLVNVVDTSQGASIGLLNFIGNGFYKVTYSASDMSNTNVSLKTGTHSFYSELLTSTNISADQKFYSFGLGVGHDFMFSDKVYLSAEANYQFANTGLWDDRWTQGKLLLNVQLTKNISLVGGPTFNHYNHSGTLHQNGYKNITNLPEFGVSRQPYNFSEYGHQTKNWVGWQVGIAFNSVFKPTKRAADRSQGWYLGVAATGGLGWDEPYGIVTGAELAVQRDLGENLAGTLASGYTHFSVQQKYTFEASTNIYNSYPSINVVPVKAGIRLKTGGAFYMAGEIGAAFSSEADRRSFGVTGPNITPTMHYRSFMYGVSAGIGFKNGLETGLKFEDYGLQSQHKQFALRLGYRIKLSK